MTTDQISVAILFCIVIVIPALVVILDDGNWERKKKTDD